MKNLFELIDINGKGYITKEEFSKVYNNNVSYENDKKLNSV